MRKFLIGLVALLVVSSLAWAADNYRLNTASGTVTTFKTTDTGGVHVPHVNIDSGTITATATTTATAASALPSLSAGADKSTYESLSGGLYVQPIVGTNIVDSTHGIPVLSQTGATWSTTAASGAFVDGAIATIGAQADAAWVSGSGTLVAINKNIAAAASRLITSAGPTAPGSALSTTSFMVGARYNATPPTFTDGQEGGFQIDANGRLLASLASAGPVAPGTVAAKSNLVGCQYNATSPSPSDTQQLAIQCGPNGRILSASGTSTRVTNTPTVQNAAYASGNCIGGFQSITVTNYNGQSGFLTNFRVTSVGGSTPTITVYVFDSNPSSSTCTDKSTFTLNAADVDKMVATPVAMTLAAPTGTSVTFGSVDWTPPRPFMAGGSVSSGVKTIYYALVSGSTFTPATTTDLHTSTGVALN